MNSEWVTGLVSLSVTVGDTTMYCMYEVAFKSMYSIVKIAWVCCQTNAFPIHCLECRMPQQIHRKSVFVMLELTSTGVSTISYLTTECLFWYYMN